DHLGRGGELAAQDLHGGLSPQEAVLRFVDRAAASRRELLLQDVGARDRARLEGIGVRGLPQRPGARGRPKRARLVVVVFYGQRSRPFRCQPAVDNALSLPLSEAYWE